VTVFAILAVVLIASAIFTVTQKSPVYSVIGLLANFIALAVLYFSLDAEFLGIIQIVVYSGAILMLFVFVIALLSSGIGPFRLGENKMPRAVVPAIVATVAAFALLIFGVASRPIGALPPHTPTSTLGAVGDPGVFGSVADFGRELFTAQLLPFEVTALVLMVAVIGVVMIAGDAVPQPTLGRHRPQKKSLERESIVKTPR